MMAERPRPQLSRHHLAKEAPLLEDLHGHLDFLDTTSLDSLRKGLDSTLLLSLLELMAEGLVH